MPLECAPSFWEGEFLIKAEDLSWTGTDLDPENRFKSDESKKQVPTHSAIIISQHRNMDSMRKNEGWIMDAKNLNKSHTCVLFASRGRRAFRIRSPPHGNCALFLDENCIVDRLQNEEQGKRKRCVSTELSAQTNGACVTKMGYSHCDERLESSILKIEKLFKNKTNHFHSVVCICTLFLAY